MTTPASVATPPRESRGRAAGCLLLLVAAVQLVLGPLLQLSQWDLSAERNAGVAEAVSWLSGRADLPHADDPLHHRLHDTALFRGRVFNIFPPLIGFFTIGLAPVHRLLLGRVDLWLGPVYVLAAYGPVVILAYLLLRRESNDSAWGALLALGYLGGTALLPMCFHARFGQAVHLNHVLSQTGLLLLTWDALGRRRVWPGLIGLALATWSRQMTLLYALPLLWLARRRGRLGAACAGAAVIVAPLLALNWVKFGSPFDSGYRYVYAGRDDFLSHRAAAHGLFSPHFVAQNAWFMHAALPVPRLSGDGVRFETDELGASIWFTSPMLLYVFVAARRWWADPARRGLMLASLAVMAGHLLYHNTGYVQPGYSRFALDFIPVWLAVAAPATRGGIRTPFTLAATAWSLLYFQSLGLRM
ncbi:MAG: hypothetical protein U1A27_11425 [Phycisphaerae bacterium]